MMLYCVYFTYMSPYGFMCWHVAGSWCYCHAAVSARNSSGVVWLVLNTTVFIFLLSIMKDFFSNCKCYYPLNPICLAELCGVCSIWANRRHRWCRVPNDWVLLFSVPFISSAPKDINQSYGHGVHYLCAPCLLKQVANSPKGEKVPHSQGSDLLDVANPLTELPPQPNKPSEACHVANLNSL